MQLQFYLQDAMGHGANISADVTRSTFPPFSYSGEWRLQAPAGALPPGAASGAVAGSQGNVHLTRVDRDRVRTLVTMTRLAQNARGASQRAAVAAQYMMFFSGVGTLIEFGSETLPGDLFPVAHSGTLVIHPDIELFGHGLLKPGTGSWLIIH